MKGRISNALIGGICTAACWVVFGAWLNLGWRLGNKTWGDGKQPESMDREVPDFEQEETTEE